MKMKAITWYWAGRTECRMETWNNTSLQIEKRRESWKTRLRSSRKGRKKLRRVNFHAIGRKEYLIWRMQPIEKFNKMRIGSISKKNFISANQ
jgi:hypothetical protein